MVFGQIQYGQIVYNKKHIRSNGLPNRNKERNGGIMKDIIIIMGFVVVCVVCVLGVGMVDGGGVGCDEYGDDWSGGVAYREWCADYSVK